MWSYKNKKKEGGIIMMFPRKETIKKIKKRYPIGCRVRLLKMNDIQAPPVGTLGTVVHIDDTASIHVAWDNGSSLAIVYGADKCIKI